VIFDPSIDPETAIAITSAQEPTRPPSMQDDKPDPEGQRRIAQLISQALRQPTKEKRTMPQEGQTRTVKAIKEANQKALRKRTHSQPPEVVHETPVDKPLIHNQFTTSEVVQNTERTTIDSSTSINNIKTVLNNQELFELIETGLTEVEIAEDLDILLPLFQAEGLSPSSRVLADSILQLHRDAR
jgi:hypothetical protein